ncbi:MAG TPA: hypothetical protein VJS17_02490 [Pyrinomonadaceae bacterium]|nr:hypothetical protein [Pyrinomonadaceae bacterium]
MRFVTAPCIGLLVGALEGGIVFAILTIIDVQRATGQGIDTELLYLTTTSGIVYGSIVGAVIGVVVALRDAGGLGGLVIGSLAGVALAIYIIYDTPRFDDFMRTLAVIVFPAAQSIGLLSSGLSARRKQHPDLQ